MSIGLVEIEGFVIVIAGICAAIVLIGNVVRTIKGAAKPAKEFAQRVDDLERKVSGDWEFRQEQEEFNKLMLKSMKQLMKHEIDGNDVKGLQAMEAEIDAFLIENV